MMVDKREQRGPHIAIIGAGVGGISTAIALKKQLGFENFTIYEKANNIGGTWRDNIYPGCACDIAGHWYSLSTDLNPNWTDHYPVQEELLQYWLGLVEKHDLRKHIKFNSKLTLAKWDNERQLYEMEFEEWGPEAWGKEDSERTKWTEEAEALVNAIGGFTTLGYPKRIFGEDYEKQEVFKGQVFHAGKWRYDIPLKGKRVGVVGNGCSVAQFLPKISEDPSVEIINFCRTPSWFAPRTNEPYSSRTKWLFTWVPGLQRAYRNVLSIRSEIRVLGMYKAREGIQETVRKEFTKYIRATAPEKYHDKLIPSYPVGCKRIIIDPGYLKALHRPNISLNFDGIESLTEEGIKTGTGEIVPLDVIILGTGFAFGDLGMNVIGSEGRSLSDYFESKGGRTAYMGTCVPGFPNHFMLLGPNTATGHASVIFAEECQINYTLNLLKPIIASFQGRTPTSNKPSSSIKSYTVTHAATDAFNADLHSRHSSMVWTECTSYYRENQDGKNTAIFPGPMVLFWWWTRKVRWGDFVYVKGDGSKNVGRGVSWLKVVGVRKWMRLSAWTVLTALFAVYLRGGLPAEVIRTAVDGSRGAFVFKKVNETLRVVADRLIKW